MSAASVIDPDRLLLQEPPFTAADHSAGADQSGDQALLALTKADEPSSH